jgi:hypothetical protein
MGNSPEDIIDKIKLVFDKLREARQRIHGQKCQFAATSVKFLGLVFSGSTMATNQDKTEIVKTYPVSRTVKQLKAFLG